MAQLGFVITSSPHGGAGARSFYFLAKAALDRGYGVRAYFCEDGVYHCVRGQRPTCEGALDTTSNLNSLLERGAEIVVSSDCMKARGISFDNLCDVKFGNYEALARIIGQVDRMVCL